MLFCVSAPVLLWVRAPGFLLCCCTAASQVRSVCVGEIGIITGSRDTTIKIWADDGASSCSLLHTLV